MSLGANTLKSLSAALPSGQLVYSPFSISMAMCMVSLGASGETLSEIDNVFKCNHERNAHVVKEIVSDKTVNIMNAVFPLEGLNMKEKFVESISKFYNTSIHPLPYSTKPEDCRTTINRFVEENTKGKIKDLLPQNSIKESTRNVLVNTVHLDVKWKTNFDKSLTHMSPFYTNFRSISNVEMMTFSQSQTIDWRDYGNNIESISLPLATEGFVMEFVKPPVYSENSLKETEMAVLSKPFTTTQRIRFSKVKIPKIEISSKLNLEETLQKTGIVRAFSSRSDFSNMFEEGSRFSIGSCIHEAKVSIGEEGVVASAATAVSIVLRTSISHAEKEFILDGPFLAFLKYKDNILFTMRILHPNPSE